MSAENKLIKGAMLGAGLMYYLDPDKGRRRRARLRDQFVHWMYEADEALDIAGRDLKNRTRGLMAETRSRLRLQQVDDSTLEARVRSALGRLVSHPRAIQVQAENGTVILSGPVLEAELEGLVGGVRRVAGVRQVIQRSLEVHREAGEVPALQGEGREVRRGPDVMQEHWAPATRLLMGLVGGGLSLRALGEKGMVDRALGTVGLAVLLRSLTNQEVTRLVGVDAGREVVKFQKTLHVQAPLEEVFRFWSNYENFPRFMSHLQEVRNTGEGRSHWVARGPAGVPMAWDAETVGYEENRCIAWRSIGHPPVENAGRVRFSHDADGGTCVDIHLSYNPPAGALGHVVAALFRVDPKSAMDEDLLRLKTLLEEGRTESLMEA